MELSAVRKQLFFIVGCPRSGTTLLQSMLASHPDVILPDETGFYTRIYPQYVEEWSELAEPENFNQALAATLDFYRIKDLGLDPTVVRSKCQNEPQSWETIFLAILATYAQKHQAHRVGEKTPRHFACIELLHERFPQAKFVHLVRDPRAVVLSLMQAPFGSNRIANSCNLWQEAIQIHREYAEQLGSQKYQVIKYENLVRAPQATLKIICNFLNFEFSPQMLKFNQRQELGFNKNYLEHMSNTLKPLFTSSLERWKKELSSSQISIIQIILQDEMKLMGYQTVEAKSRFPWLQYQADMLIELLEYKVSGIKRQFEQIFSSYN